MFPKSFLLVFILVVFVATLNIAMREAGTVQGETLTKVGVWYKRELVSFDSMLSAYPKYFYDSSYSTRHARYQELARQSKKIEVLFSYLHPELSFKTFQLPASFQPRNFGPPFPDNWLFIGPFGIEADSTLKTTSKDDVQFSVAFIKRSVQNFQTALRAHSVDEDIAGITLTDVFQAVRLQLIRASTIGISNGELTIEDAAVPALQGQLEGCQAITALLAENAPQYAQPYTNAIEKSLQLSLARVRAITDFKSFDRLSLLTDALVPIATNLFELQKSLKVSPATTSSALNATARHIYEGNVFNANYFAPGEEAYATKAKIELGKLLFFDPVLSDNNKRACASCHKPEMGFTDGNIKSLTFDRNELPRNAPTVLNAAFQTKQFWDLRATSLEDQLDSVINNKDEMHSSFENVIARLNGSTEYRQLFTKAFPETKTGGIARKHVKIAIACYERELTSFNSKFDQYMAGNQAALNQDEQKGFNLFMGKARCGSCHYAPLFTGSLPPYFEFTDHRAIGVPVKDTMDIYQVDTDTGFSKVSKNPLTHFSFKVPTVRNVALTAPYMHNGVYRTLEQVVEFYNDGAGTKFQKQMRPGMKGLPFFMILPDKLNLDAREKQDLIAFMKALTDNSAADDVPDKLPVITGKYATFNKRRVGGVY